MTFRRRVLYKGRLTNRVNCPKRLAEEGLKLQSFDKCRGCEHAEEILAGGVECGF